MSEMKEELDYGDGTVLFDDWSDVMNRLVDIRAEKEVLGSSRTKESSREKNSWLHLPLHDCSTFGLRLLSSLCST